MEGGGPAPSPYVSPINVFVPASPLIQQATSKDEPISEQEFEPVYVPNSATQPEVTKRSTRVLVQSRWLKDYVTPHHLMANQVSITPLQTQFQAFLCALVVESTPTYFKEAGKDADWCKSMNDKLRALEENDTWEITTLPKDKKAKACHCIYKTKLKADDSLDRKKARLVINGNRKRKGIDMRRHLLQ
ncbi:cysteine-rich receptor-like protein kinase 8 [Tanacetum coccineum]